MPDLLRRLARLLAPLLLAAAPAAGAITPDQLPPVDQVFVPSARYTDGAIELRWTIAKGYYLYRHRTAAQANAGFDAQPLQLPKGDAHRDEFFGDVETYRGELVGRLPGTPTAASTVVTIKYQGCADAGVCYPPQTRKLTVALPVADDTSAASPFGGSPFGRARGAAPGTDAAPLPEQQAFGFEAIPGDGGRILVRFTPAPGYYLYRDRTTFRLDAASRAAGIALGAPAWPPAKAHRDEHFGNVAVYFDEAEFALPVARTATAARMLQLTARFQGCQTDGICYPPMERTIAVALPAGAAKTLPTPPAPTAPALPDTAAIAPIASPSTTAIDATPTATPTAPPRQPPPAARSIAAARPRRPCRR
ncbi:protein-disulfide reductase DsbD N-terminal domain-containing protein [Lysobacter xanthus]